MTGTVHQEVVNVLTEKVNGRESFTAYEITQEARRRVGPTVNIPHRETRDFVRRDFSVDGEVFSPDYRMTVVELNVAGNPEAMLYHPPENDPCDHPLVDCLQGSRSQPDDSDVDDSDGPQDHDPIDPTATGKDTDDDDEEADSSIGVQADGSVIVKVNKGNEVTVPHRLLSSVTKVNGSYDLIVGGDTITRTGEKDGKVRLHVAHLRGISSGNTFRISADSAKNTITITSA